MNKPNRMDYYHQIVDQNHHEIGKRLDVYEYMKALEDYVNHIDSDKNSVIDGIISESDKEPQSSIDPTKPFPQSGTWVGSETKRTAVIDNPCELWGEEISKPYDFKVCENCYHKLMSER